MITIFRVNKIKGSICQGGWWIEKGKLYAIYFFIWRLVVIAKAKDKQALAQMQTENTKLKQTIETMTMEHKEQVRIDLFNNFRMTHYEKIFN